MDPIKRLDKPYSQSKKEIFDYLAERRDASVLDLYNNHESIWAAYFFDTSSPMHTLAHLLASLFLDNYQVSAESEGWVVIIEDMMQGETITPERARDTLYAWWQIHLQNCVVESLYLSLVEEGQISQTALKPGTEYGERIRILE